MNENIRVVERFLQALNDGAAGDVLNEFYDPAIVQIEFPNLLTKEKTVRTLPDLVEASLKGKRVVPSQKFSIVESYAVGDVVIIEALWTGTLSIPLGKITAGGEMKAYFAQFYRFRNGKIVEQRNYDCFENFLN